MDFSYRLRQLWHNLTAKPLLPSELSELQEALTPEETALFLQMSNGDQQHAYRVFQTLKSQGRTDADLLTAALLHDIGKIRAGVTALDRSLAVLGETFVPHRAAAWGRGEARGWKRAFVVRDQHAEWGADLAQEVGSRPGVIDLIRHHQDEAPPEDAGKRELLRMLQFADDQS